MKIRIPGICSGIISAMVLVLISCSGSDVGTDMPEPVSPDGVPLRFSVGGSDARAEITSDNLKEFTVWSSMRRTDAAADETWMNVFGTASVVVSKNPNDDNADNADNADWSYTGGDRYWFEGFTYTFLALASKADQGQAQVTPEYVLAGDGNSHYLKITDFDGTQGTDLAYATETRDVTNDALTKLDVNLSFHHLTSRIEFWGSLDSSAGKKVKISSVKVYGVNSIGSWNGASFDPFASNFGTWTSNTLSTIIDKSYKESTEDITIEPDNQAKNLLGVGGAVIMIPQEVPVEARITIEYFYTDTSTDTSTDTKTGKSTDTRTITLNLYEASLSIGDEWLPGKSYEYVVNIGAADNIFFDTPTVDPWNYVSGGGNIIIQ